VFNTGRFNNFNASKPFTFNNAGTFAYTGPSYDRAFPNYKMNGSITVVNQPLATSFNTTNAIATTSAASSSSPTSSSQADIGDNSSDTIATLMVPSRLLGTTISDLKNQGFTIDNQYPFESTWRWFTIWRRKTTSIVSVDKHGKEPKSSNICIGTDCIYVTI
jgi:hypothetical protein